MRRSRIAGAAACVIAWAGLAGAGVAIAGEASWCESAAAALRLGNEPIDAGSDWFHVQGVAAGVFAISEPRQYEGVTSFLIVGSERALLFDTGLGVAGIGEVVRRLTPLPVTVLNSHTHFDHVGGNREFADVRNLDEPTSRASARGDVPAAIAEYAGDTLAEDRVCGPLPAGVASRAYAIPRWNVAATLRDGERFELGGRVLELLRTPGHAPDAICLLDRANGLLLTGDTYYSGEIYLWSPDTDIAAYTASIAELAGLAPGLKRLLPAHGPPVAEPARLGELAAALAAVESGDARPEAAPDGRLLYRFGHFSLLTAAPAGGD